MRYNHNLASGHGDNSFLSPSSLCSHHLVIDGKIFIKKKWLELNQFNGYTRFNHYCDSISLKTLMYFNMWVEVVECLDRCRQEKDRFHVFRNSYDKENNLKNWGHGASKSRISSSIICT